MPADITDGNVAVQEEMDFHLYLTKMLIHPCSQVLVLLIRLMAPKRAKFSTKSIALSLGCSLMLASQSMATGIDQLILDRVPVPTKRPDISKLISEAETTQPATQQTSSINTGQIAGLPLSDAPARPGSFDAGLKALSEKKPGVAIGIRKNLASKSIEHKVLSWMIALSGQSGIPSGEIQNAMNELRGWPAQTSMRRSFELAFAREGHGAHRTIDVLGTAEPESVEGGIALAKAYLAVGDGNKANAAIAPIWREEKLGNRTEKRILSAVGKALTRADHRFRMHRMFYRDRAKDGLRMGSLAEQVSLAKARAAVVRRNKKAGSLLNAVAASSKKDPGFLFAQIQQARRSGDAKQAAKLMLTAPKGKEQIVHPDEWWVERRLISREMLDLGDARTAYKIAANHSAESPSSIAEAEFHAGWYALRYLKDRTRARKHFENILKVSSRPISQARGYYWLGRAQSGLASRKFYQEAAKYPGTFYGQLALVELKQRKLGIQKTRPSGADRARFSSRELVRAIELLEKHDQDSRAGIIYRHLARTLNSPGELALLSARAEKTGNRPLALQVGKIAHGRGLEVDSLSWPVGAIPASAKTGTAGKALAYAVARQESAFNPAAVSPAKARGLLQLLPGTAKQVARQIGAKYSFKRLTSDPAYNVMLGSAYLDEQLNNFGNSYILTFAGYNAGPGRVRDWLEKYGDPRGKPLHQVIDWIERIPFTETRNYVQRVMENYQVYKARLGEGGFTLEKDLVRGRK